ncbi:sulfur carrier protein ThiS [Pontimicrobium sp. MEBiC01747]
MITVNINQKQHQVVKNTSLKTLLTQLDITSTGIAVAINNTIISQDDWGVQKLQHNDTILIITATQGG